MKQCQIEQIVVGDTNSRRSRKMMVSKEKLCYNIKSLSQIGLSFFSSFFSLLLVHVVARLLAFFVRNGRNLHCNFGNCFVDETNSRSVYALGPTGEVDSQDAPTRRSS